MQRMAHVRRRTRFVEIRRAVSAVLAALFMILLYAAAGYIYQQSRRMGKLLYDEQWKTPTLVFARSDLSSPILEVYGSEWRQTTPVLIDQIPAHVPEAFLAAEDTRFYSHIGLDGFGLLRALLVNVRSRRVEQGGSTITQQLVKSTVLSNERTLRRKVVEAPLSLRLEQRLTKSQILEAYLNEVYLGHAGGRSIRGVDEAAPIYFGQPPADLSPAEAALLAAIVRAPNRDNPERNPDRALARRNRILETMRARGVIDDEELSRALAQPAQFRRAARPAEKHRWYLRAMRRELVDEIGAKAAGAGGLRIVASIDPKMQRAAELASARELERLRGSYSWIREREAEEPLQAAVVTLDPIDGAVLAAVGGSQAAGTFDRTTMMRRQPGSAFKPFVYAAAIESREMTPATLLLDMPFEVPLGQGKQWTPVNYDEQFHGRVTLRRAFEASLNIPAVRVSEQIGRRSVIRAAERHGLGDNVRDVPALALGVAEVSPMELAAAFTVFPNLGRIVEPYYVGRVEDRRSNLLFERRTVSRRVLEEPEAWVMHSLLRGVVTRGTARRLRDYGLGYAAGKTGTTSGYRDAWFVGYTPKAVTAVWVGFDSGAPLRLSSAEAALPLWGRYMNDFHPEEKEIDPPPGVVHERIDPQTGYLWRPGCPGPFEEVFVEGTEPRIPCPPGRVGQIARDLLLDPDRIDEPAAITLEKFRQLSEEIDRGRRRVERGIDRLRNALSKVLD
jgi:penicillin-binding protein 1B